MEKLEELLSQLHSEIAVQLLKKIKSGEATAADFVAAMRFLKENGYDAAPKEGTPTHDLSKLVPFPSADTVGDYH